MRRVRHLSGLCLGSAADRMATACSWPHLPTPRQYTRGQPASCPPTPPLITPLSLKNSIFRSWGLGVQKSDPRRPLPVLFFLSLCLPIVEKSPQTGYVKVCVTRQMPIEANNHRSPSRNSVVDVDSTPPTYPCLVNWPHSFIPDE